MNRCIFILLFCLIPIVATSKKLDSISASTHKEFYLDWDNDVFVNTDHYYSQGLHLYFVHPVFKKNPLNHILLRLRNADNYFGLGMVQEIYTPKDIVDTLLNNIDRPYSGTLYFRSFLLSSNPEKRVSLSTQVDLGFLGPLSGAKLAQQLIHKWTGSKPPNGWDFQIDNRPYINYNVILEHGFISSSYFELLTNSRIRLGNIHDDFRIGMSIRTGKLNNYFEGLNLKKKTYGEKNELHFAILGGIDLNLIAYNATLMGGIIPPRSSHQFEFKEIDNFVIDINGGIQASYRGVGIRCKFTWKSKEFEHGEDHAWGTISMYFRL